MKDKTRAAIELSMSMIIFATIVYVFVTAAMVDLGGATIPSPFTFSVITPIIVPSLASCGSPIIPFTDWVCPVGTFVGWLIDAIIAIVNFIAGILAFLISLASIFLFTWIWVGSPVTCGTVGGVACVIPAAPFPLNFLFGIPLTLMGVVLIVRVVQVVEGLFPWFRGDK